MSLSSEVILVHGLWFGSWSMAQLAKNLKVEGFSVRRFDYSSTSAQLDDHSGQLLEFARQTASDHLHFVAHSLGGLVTLNMLNKQPDLPPGRVALLGSPLAGSISARRMRRVPGAEKLLGQIRTALERGYGQLDSGHETGMISGTKSIGLGRLLGGTGKPGDGTVTVDETRTTGLKDHLLLPVSHTSMLYSAEVARQAAHFLRTGSFDWPVAC